MAPLPLPLEEKGLLRGFGLWRMRRSKATLTRLGRTPKIDIIILLVCWQCV